MGGVKMGYFSPNKIETCPNKPLPAQIKLTPAQIQRISKDGKCDTQAANYLVGCFWFLQQLSENGQKLTKNQSRWLEGGNPLPVNTITFTLLCSQPQNTIILDEIGQLWCLMTSFNRTYLYSYTINHTKFGEDQMKHGWVIMQTRKWWQTNIITTTLVLPRGNEENFSNYLFLP